jgi:hypothetical protein
MPGLSSSSFIYYGKELGNIKRMIAKNIFDRKLCVCVASDSLSECTCKKNVSTEEEDLPPV